MLHLLHHSCPIPQTEQEALQAFNKKLPAAFANLLQHLTGLPMLPQLCSTPGKDKPQECQTQCVDAACMPFGAHVMANKKPSQPDWCLTEPTMRKSSVPGKGISRGRALAVDSCSGLWYLCSPKVFWRPGCQQMHDKQILAAGPCVLPFNMILMDSMVNRLPLTHMQWCSPCTLYVSYVCAINTGGSAGWMFHTYDGLLMCCITALMQVAIP